MVVLKPWKSIRKNDRQIKYKESDKKIKRKERQEMVAQLYRML